MESTHVIVVLCVRRTTSVSFLEKLSMYDGEFISWERVTISRWDKQNQWQYWKDISVQPEYSVPGSLNETQGD